MTQKIHLAALAIVCLAGPAFAQAVVKVAPATARAPQNSVPGYYNPATRTFTALPAEGVNPSFSTETGRVRIHINYDFDSLLKPEDTVFCNIEVSFGTLTDSLLFTNHTQKTSMNFAVGTPTKDVDIPYSYTPTSSKIGARVFIECRATDEYFQDHSYAQLSAAHTVTADISQIFDVAM
jgi:hypothetical protein